MCKLTKTVGKVLTLIISLLMFLSYGGRLWTFPAAFFFFFFSKIDNEIQQNQ